MSFLDDVESLSAEMRKVATQLATCVRNTKSDHETYAALHHLERTCYDTATQLDLLLTPEMRAKLANI